MHNMSEIKALPWFHGVDWDHIRNSSLQTIYLIKKIFIPIAYVSKVRCFIGLALSLFIDILCSSFVRLYVRPLSVSMSVLCPSLCSLSISMSVLCPSRCTSLCPSFDRPYMVPLVFLCILCIPFHICRREASTEYGNLLLSFLF